jgi:hypothetical protein
VVEEHYLSHPTSSQADDIRRYSGSVAVAGPKPTGSIASSQVRTAEYSGDFPASVLRA